jgi:class 3 adenylate cyclase
MKNLVIIFLATISLMTLSCSNGSQQAPKAVKGVLDLRGWDFGKDGIVRLDGEWEFYWKQFLSSKDFDTLKTKHFIPVPKPWNGYKWGNEELGYEGYATYRLRILVNNKTKDFGLKFPDQGTAFELYLNDSLVGKNGKIGKSRETSEPQYKPLLIPFERTGDTITIVCKVSNYDFHFGGIYFAGLVGAESDIRKKRDSLYLMDYIVATTLFIFFLILVLFFILMPKDKVSLLFSIFTFFAVIRTITTNERIINELFEFFSWEMYIKIEALSWQFSAPFFCISSWLLFKKDFSKTLLFIFSSGLLLIAILTILTPSRINSQLIFPGQILIALTFIYYIVVLTISIKRKRESSAIMLLGFIPFFLSSVNEVLYYNNLMPLYINYPQGLVIYSFSWIIILARRFSFAYKRIENYAKDLKNEVEEKTKDLRIEKEKSEQLLLNVLPDQIAERLKQGEQPIADHFDEASVVFIDIVDFTKLSAKSTPQKMVNMLNEVFTHFDKIAEKYGLEKIKTIGDCYMAAAGIPIHRTDHAEAIARMAIESMETMNGYITEDGHEIQFRVGLDCGPIVAGVIGKQKFIYDLWGDMVNTASRMETNGITGRIQCTERFKDKLGSRSEELGIKLEERGEIEVKGKGMMKTYFIN